jgi:hypothetical protein
MQYSEIRRRLSFQSQNMKTICLAILMSIALGLGAAMAQGVGAQNPGGLTSPEVSAIFLFGRANYFRVVVQQRRCNLLDADTVNAINQRFENARQQLAARYGDRTFPADMPVNGPVREAECDRMTLNSYSNHVAEIEQYVASMK